MLISIKNSREALIVSQYARVSIIDLKDPKSGSLGYAGARAIANVAAAVGKTKLFSVAFGELDQWKERNAENNAANQLMASTPKKTRWFLSEMAGLPWDSIDYVKIGLSGASLQQWPISERLSRLRCFFRHVPETAQRVLVLYADVFDAPDAMAILEAATADRDLKFTVLLLDTFDKAAGNLFRHYSPAECRMLFDAATGKKMQTVLAGSIDGDDLPLAKETGAGLVGVRGAVCTPSAGAESKRSAIDRSNDLCPDQLERFLNAAQLTLVEST